MANLIRLDKLLCDMGLGTRSEIKKMIQKGRVQIDGSIEKNADRKLDPSEHEIFFCNEPVSFSFYEYVMLHKPQGVISATEDRKQKTVLDLLADAGFRKDLCIVGRLDMDTEGLLFLTNDGALNHALLSPKHHVDKTYEVQLDRDLPEGTKERFLRGITIDDEDGTFDAMPAVLKEGTSSRHCYLTIQEGKFHQVKRMFAAVGCTVTYLKRLSMGPLVLDPDLGLGEYRKLSSEEVAALKQAAGLEV